MCESFASAFRRVAVNSSRLIIALSARCGDMFMYSVIRDAISEKYPSVRHDIFVLDIRRYCRVKLSGSTSIRAFSSMGMMWFIFFRVFCFECAESDQSKLRQFLEIYFRLFRAHASPRSFFEDPLGTGDELGGEGGHGGELCIYVDFGRIKKPRFCVVFLVTKLFKNLLISFYFPYTSDFSLWRLSFCTSRYSMSGFRGFFRSTVCTLCIVQDFSYS